MKFSLSKAERLKSERIIGELFKTGQVVKSYPVRALFIVSESSSPEVKVAFSAPKRNFKKAVERNKCKRLLRESYRLNKHILLSELSFKAINVMFIYTSSEQLEFHDVEKVMQKLLHRLNEKLQSEAGQ